MTTARILYTKTRHSPVNYRKNSSFRARGACAAVRQRNSRMHFGGGALFSVVCSLAPRDPEITWHISEERRRSVFLSGSHCLSVGSSRCRDCESRRIASAKCAPGASSPQVMAPGPPVPTTSSPAALLYSSRPSWTMEQVPSAAHAPTTTF